MILVDKALKARADSGSPLRVALVGAGFVGRGVAYQMLTTTTGIQLVAIANRHVEAALEAYRAAGIDPIEVCSASEIESAVADARPVVTDDPLLVCATPGVDVVIEATGTVEFGARVALDALKSKKHVVLVNVQLDATLGPILKTYADKAGVLISGADGDQPAAQMNLFRFARAIGMTPLVCGNIKGFLDHYRTPETQKEYAERWNQRPQMVTSFADGTEISFEQATVANATGMRVARRGMVGRTHTGHVDELVRMYDFEELKRTGGVVDFVVGAEPSPGVFVLAGHSDPRQQHYLDLYKLGKGPVYCLYTPYHLVHFEIPLSVGRMALFEDAPITPRGRPVVDVVATAKANLASGAVLDGIGGFCVYGQCENADVVHAERLLPMGLAEGCTLRRPVGKDAVLTYDDVELPANRLSNQLRREQDSMFFGSAAGD